MWIALALAGLAVAGEAEAERYRLQTEMESLAKRNAWAGVERTFDALDALGLELTLEDYLLGGQAALAEGNLLEALGRLQKGLQTQADPGDPSSAYAAADALEERLRSAYGYVHVVVYPSEKKVPELQRPEMPFSAEEQKAITFAQGRIAETRAFMGLLPIGSYLLGEQRFEVTSGAPMLELRVGDPPAAGTVVTGQQ